MHDVFEIRGTELTAQNIVFELSVDTSSERALSSAAWIFRVDEEKAGTDEQCLAAVGEIAKGRLVIVSLSSSVGLDVVGLCRSVDVHVAGSRVM